MRAQGWNQERFVELLRGIRERTALSDQDLAHLAGRSRSQVNRWTRAEHQPAYEPLLRLANNLAARDESLSGLAQELLVAAGYEPAPVGTTHRSDTSTAEREPASARATGPPDDLPENVKKAWRDLPEGERYLWRAPYSALVRRALVAMAQTLSGAEPNDPQSAETSLLRDIG